MTHPWCRRIAVGRRIRRHTCEDPPRKPPEPGFARPGWGSCGSSGWGVTGHPPPRSCPLCCVAYDPEYKSQIIRARSRWQTPGRTQCVPCGSCAEAIGHWYDVAPLSPARFVRSPILPEQLCSAPQGCRIKGEPFSQTFKKLVACWSVVM